MIIDVHAHLWGKGFVPPAFFRKDAEAWAAKSPDRSPNMIMPKLLSGIEEPTGERYVANMDNANVDVTIVHATDFGIHWSGEEPEVSIEDQLRFYGQLHRSYPDRLYYFAFIDPRRDNCVQLLEKAVTEWGAIGYGELTPHGFSVTDEIMKPVFRKCMELNIPVFIHTRAGHGTSIDGTDFTRMNTAHPCHVEALKDMFPELTVIIGHTGFPVWWQEAARIARKYSNCYLDLSNWNFGLNAADMIPKLAAMREMTGIEKLLFGSDQPSGVRFYGEKSFLPSWVKFFQSMTEEAEKLGYHFSKEDVDLILGGNAKKLLNL